MLEMLIGESSSLGSYEAVSINSEPVHEARTDPNLPFENSTS